MTVIFDFDGTLANTLDLILDLYNRHITKEFRCKPFDKSRLEELRGRKPASFLKEYNVTPLKLPFIVLRVRRLLKQYMTEVQPHKGIAQLLSTLNERNIDMGIVTSNSRSNVEVFLAQHSWEHYFRFIRSSRSLVSKRRSFEKVIAQYQLERETILYVGDEVRDIKACKASKLQCAAVTWGHQNRSLLSQYQPEVIVDEALEILHYLDREFVSSDVFGGVQ
jgi:phosphoglycolate phosphatase-like HAD superfamily hydrolase